MLLLLSIGVGILCVVEVVGDFAVDVVIVVVVVVVVLVVCGSLMLSF